MRAIVACGWFGIQAWIGGAALHTFFTAIFPGWPTLLGNKIGGHTPTEWISFLLFWAINILIIYRGMDLLRKVENWAAPFVLIMTAFRLAGAIWRAHGLGYLLTEKGKFATWSQFRTVCVPSLTAMIGFWATLSLNMPMTELWDPVKLVAQFKAPLVIAISMFTVVVATLAVNIAANVVSPANDFANAFPRWISSRTGGLSTGILGILLHPARMLADPSAYISP